MFNGQADWSQPEVSRMEIFMKKLMMLATLMTVFASWGAFAWGLGDFQKELISPAKDKTARTILYVGTGLTLAAMIFEEELDRSQDKIVDKKPLGDFSLYGDAAGRLVPNIAYVLGQSIASWSGNDKGSRRAMEMFKASAYAASVTTVLKYSIREPRPNEHKDRNSFPSGHSSTVFAFAGYVMAEHGWEWGVPAMALATLTGVGRINDNRHRTHDVLAGATIGLAYAYGIASLSAGAQTVSQYQFVPIYDEETKGILATYTY